MQRLTVDLLAPRHSVIQKKFNTHKVTQDDFLESGAAILRAKQQSQAVSHTFIQAAMQ